MMSIFLKSLIESIFTKKQIPKINETTLKEKFYKYFALQIKLFSIVFKSIL